jgi:hypothetical protein
MRLCDVFRSHLRLSVIYSSVRSRLKAMFPMARLETVCLGGNWNLRVQGSRTHTNDCYVHSFCVGESNGARI